MNPILESAKFYHSLGWSIIPVKPKSKVPLVKWEEYQKRQATLAELEQAQIQDKAPKRQQKQWR